jgi:sterol 14-demethylase
MNCLDRALHETARLRPVAPVMLRRVLRPVDIRGLVIPAGADVFVAPVLSHRLPVLFDHADQYHPDRFLANARQTSYLHGFGGGTHRCLGEHFADLLTHVTVTRLLQHYELTLVSPQPVPVRTPAFKGPRSPCLIRYRARSSSARGPARP